MSHYSSHSLPVHNKDSATQFKNKILTHENQSLHIQNILSHEENHFSHVQYQELLHKCHQEKQEMQAMYRDAQRRIRLLEEERHVMRTHMDHLMEKNELWIQQSGGPQRTSSSGGSRKSKKNTRSKSSTNSKKRTQQRVDESIHRESDSLRSASHADRNTTSSSTRISSFHSQPPPSHDHINVLEASINHRNQLQQENQALHSQIQKLQDKILLRDEEIQQLSRQCMEPSTEQLRQGEKEMENQRAVKQLLSHVHFLQQQLEEVHGELAKERGYQERCTCRYQHGVHKM